jgi:hypothetical protein
MVELQNRWPPEANSNKNGSPRISTSSRSSLLQEYLGNPQLLEVQGIFCYQQAHFVDMLGFEG